MPNFARDTSGAVIAMLASVLGLWLGLAGPETSPVEPSKAPAQVQLGPDDPGGHGPGGRGPQ